MASDGGNQWDDEPRIELRGDPAYRQRGADYAELCGREMVEARRSPSGFGPLRFALAAGAGRLRRLGILCLLLGHRQPEPEELPVVAAPSGWRRNHPPNLAAWRSAIRTAWS